MIKNNYYPFSAVAGQEDIKLALILNVINPRIGGVLVSGEKGTGKSTLVRGLSQLQSGVDVVNVPLGITEDRLTGSLDFEAAVKNGKKDVEKGLLYKADGNILYIDEVNLLSEHIVNILLTVSSMGQNIVEREGVSFAHPCRFAMVGSMNPEEGLLKPHLLDKFGLYVQARGEKDVALRTEIMKRRLEYERNPVLFLEKYRQDDGKLSGRIENAKGLLKQVEITQEQYALFADISTNGNCAGHRCEIALAETAKAIASFNGRTLITEEDIKRAAGFALMHRMRQTPMQTAQQQETAEDNSEPPTEETEQEQDGHDLQNTAPDTQSFNEKEQTEEISDKRDLSLSTDFKSRKLMAGSGKRNKIKTDAKTGRYVRSRMPNGKPTDIAIDATIRAAAVYQKNRAENGLTIKIASDDIREKVREKRTGVTILFVVDASGSMGAKRRMRAVKGAVMSLLDEAYQKRDRVGIVAFKGGGGEVLLNITRSVDLAEKQLRSLPTGGKTPLASGLYLACQLLKAEKLKDPDALLYLVLVTDGKANVPLKSDNPLKDALETAESLKRLGASSLVIDTENTRIKFGFAKELSECLESKYIKLDSVSKSEITSNVKDLIKINR